MSDLAPAVAVCRHCGKEPEVDGDHTCSCSYSDDECPNHEAAPWTT